MVELGVLRGEELFESLDQVDDFTLGIKDSDTDTAEVVLSGFATVESSPNTYRVRCDPGAAIVNARDRTFIATQVAELK